MGSLDVDSLFTNITLEETIGIKEDWNYHWHKEVDAVDMRSPLGHTLANTFLEFDEKQWLKDCLREFKNSVLPILCWWYFCFIQIVWTVTPFPELS